jgi:hypothetical protein
MAQENSDGIAYLMALKHTAGPQAASATAPARDPGSDPEAGAARGSAAQPQFTGAEKRRSPRYKCEGSAEMREEGHDVRTWATFTDVSLHGCYVEAQATYPVGSELHMKLAANGITVETRGVVRVSYPYLGMGIAFSEMTDQDRTALKELLGTISRPSVIMGPGVALAQPSCGPLDVCPPIPDPGAAVRALVEFFESRHMLTRDDFLRLLQKSQPPEAMR